MPQVATCITNEHEKWLKDYFRTKNPGAEFILPWVVDTFIRAILSIKRSFSDNEFALIIAAHNNLCLQPTNSILLRIQGAYNIMQLQHLRY